MACFSTVNFYKLDPIMKVSRQKSLKVFCKLKKKKKKTLPDYTVSYASEEDTPKQPHRLQG